MLQPNQQRRRTVTGGTLMIPTHSSSSHSSTGSYLSSMPSDGSYAYSPTTAVSSHFGHDRSYQNDYVYPPAPQYTEVNVATFPQYPTDHLAFSDPSGLLQHSDWTSLQRNNEIYQGELCSNWNDNMPISHQSPSENIRYTIKSLGWDIDTRFLTKKGLYRFVLNHGRYPYYELIDPENASYSLPLQVYLSEPL